MSLDLETAPKHELVEPDAVSASEHAPLPGLHGTVRSAAYASDCPFGVFVSGSSGDWSVTSSFGVGDTHPSQAVARILDQVLEPGSQEF